MGEESAEYWIKHLNLVEHPGDEDGFFREVYRDPYIVKNNKSECRSIGTVAYFLQKTSPKFDRDSFLFKCAGTEMLFHHHGAPLSILIFNQGVERSPEVVVLGKQADKGEVLFYAVPKDTWFTRRVEAVEEEELKDAGSESQQFCVYSCSLLPGFELVDFQAERIGRLRKQKPAQ